MYCIVYAWQSIEKRDLKWKILTLQPGQKYFSSFRYSQFYVSTSGSRLTPCFLSFLVCFNITERRPTTFIISFTIASCRIQGVNSTQTLIGREVIFPLTMSKHAKFSKFYLENKKSIGIKSCSPSKIGGGWRSGRMSRNEFWGLKMPCKAWEGSFSIFSTSTAIRHK